jgi:hypothetical protein
MKAHQLNSRAWIMFCYISFAVATGFTTIGIWAMSISLEMKAFSSTRNWTRRGPKSCSAKSIR